jgi:hypothetical protein
MSQFPVFKVKITGFYKTSELTSKNQCRGNY